MCARSSFFILLLMVSPLAASAVYRCVGEHGETVFSQQPCGSTTQTVVIDSPAVADGQGLRPSERDWLARRAAGRREAKKVRRGTSAKKSREKARRQAYQCRRKRHALDALEAEMRRGYKASREVTLRRRQQRYRDYLTAFCG
jgi:hypothetical protein